MLGWLKSYATLGVGVAFALLLAWGLRVDGLRADYKSRLETIHQEAGALVGVIRVEADNPKLEWKDAPQQVRALGQAKREWKQTALYQSQAVDQMFRETQRLKKEGDSLRKEVAKAQAARESAVRKLGAAATKVIPDATCEQLMRETNAALDQVYDAGL